MFGMQKLILDNVRKMNDQYLHFSEQVNRKLELYTVGKGLLSIVLKLAVYSYILIAFLKHEVQIGEVAASVAYIVLCVRDVMEIVGSWQQLKNNNAYLERYFSYLELDEETADRSEKEVQQTPCKIEFRDVSFRYPDSKDFVLKHLNVTINPQEKIAVVGKNGSGKTTFINYDACVYRGQVRHLLKGQYWERLLIDVEPETYQNGAYWATASGWMIWCLAQQNPALAVRALEDVVSCFKTDGSFECINEGYEKLPLFVVSATNVCGGFERTISDFPEFGAGKID